MGCVELLYDISRSMIRYSGYCYKTVDLLWYVLYRYTHTVLGLRSLHVGARWARYVEVAGERLATRLRGWCTDEHVEGGVLAYLILWGIGRPSEHLLLGLARRAEVCVEDMHRLREFGINVHTSPALAKCLGLSFALGNLISYRAREEIERLASDLCTESGRDGMLFCTYTSLGKAVSAVVSRDAGTAVEVADMVDRLANKTYSIDHVLLLLIASGLIKKAIGVSTKSTDLLLDKLTERFRIEVADTIQHICKRMWTKIALSIKLTHSMR